MIDACNSGKILLPAHTFSGAPSGYSGVECRAHSFGATLQDMAIMDVVDVFLSLHGAGGGGEGRTSTRLF